MSKHYQINVAELHRRLGFMGNKIPAAASGTFPGLAIPKRDPRDGVEETVTTVTVRPAGRGPKHKRFTHRILVECPRCGTDIPAGRLHQHVGTMRCQIAHLERDNPGPVDVPERNCATCDQSFKPDDPCNDYCSDECFRNRPKEIVANPVDLAELSAEERRSAV